jgi:eukaryotic-like serine/threonine-protein kinase
MAVLKTRIRVIQQSLKGIIGFTVLTLLVYALLANVNINSSLAQIAPQVQQPPVKPTGNFLTFDNTTLGKIQYPDYWQKLQSGNSVTFVNSQLKTVGLKLESLSVNNTTLDLYTTNHIVYLRQNIPGFSIINSSQSSIASSSAQKIVYTFNGRATIYKVMQLWTLKDGRIYMITYFAQSDLFNTFLPTAQKMIDSFQVGSSSNNISNTSSLGSLLSKIPIIGNIIGKALH